MQRILKCSLTAAAVAFAVFATASDDQAGEAHDGKYAAVRSHLQTCVACHGEAGASTIPLYPILAGQEFYYLYTQLKDFKSGLRENAAMAPFIAELEKEDMKLIAEYFSEQEWPETDFEASSAQKELAKKVITAGQCVQCHRGGFDGDSRIPRGAGQHYEYLNKTMLDFKNRVRTNAAAKNSLFETFSEEEIAAVAAYMAGLK